MKIALFIATEKGYRCLKKLINSNMWDLVGFVAVFEEVNVRKSFDEDITDLCDKMGICHYYWKDIKNNILDVIKVHGINIAFTVSWKFLITTEVNGIMEHGLVVFHDSLLPKYRGFAPTPTAIMCGESRVGITAIRAANGVDEGDIILQRVIEVGDDEYISDIIGKEADIVSEMLMEIIGLAQSGGIVYRKQCEDDVSYSIWRGVADCRIDWSRPAAEIRNLVRAVSAPYPGAFCYYNRQKIIVNHVEIMPEMKFAIRQHGKIWSIEDNCPTVICGTGMLRITDACYENGDKVIFKYLRKNLGEMDI